jgi:hypothetical protein
MNKNKAPSINETSIRMNLSGYGWGANFIPVFAFGPGLPDGYFAGEQQWKNSTSFFHRVLWL